ncbi:hypothetical protein [Zooshikella harenae]|uniref:Uncharacterized protein n=1 Tax=Zooshikella harenae TaxID=2827238 RepID=A0ABS5ZGF1_9GAMM|nr:hypothetical protein [Zooshikella harenae]MBU2713124.1 hypothetical protein [Zooshikella harenae]
MDLKETLKAMRFKLYRMDMASQQDNTSELSGAELVEIYGISRFETSCTMLQETITKSDTLYFVRVT